MRLTKEEKEILLSTEKEEWKKIRSDRVLNKYKNAAKMTLKKDARLNIRISSRDKEILQRKAVEEGLPYQTFVSSILHKYVTGKIVEKP